MKKNGAKDPEASRRVSNYPHKKLRKERSRGLTKDNKKKGLIL